MTDRRSFLRTLAASAAAGSLARGESSSDPLGALLPTRKLGRAGEHITAFTLGGSHCQKAASGTEAQRIIETAIEVGVRSFDNARSYGNGESEELYGKFLTPKYREHIFLTTKSTSKTAADVRKQLEQSLRAMKTDHVDLWQIHSIHSPEDVDNRLKNGVLDEFLKAREEGKTRYLGFTGHTSFKAHLHMLKRLREREVKLDTCLMPMNLVDPHYDSFIVNVLPELIKDDYAIFAMKTLGCGTMVGTHPFWNRQKADNPDLPSLTEDLGLTVKDMHHYAYSLPIVSLISGCEQPAQVKENIGYLKNFRGMAAEERDALIAKTKPYAGRTLEYYKG
ncbi:aldo/keto reductase [Roseibacillus ishigakijimensis]|uniref:Aldo/keto reductase n=1 Tax=Roseibacillus ishigakijimensis TaxID=454146 RepID=A0A934VII1_9BACT|nr:aldo/keto reductase [Roseibacillus ishigakijimensis]MBK1835098.1 aldo/keto reductase [Roseibacillus ishigakijimensis]